MAKRTCRGGCGATITRYSTTGYCAPCSQRHQSETRTKVKPDDDRIEGSGDGVVRTVSTREQVRTLEDLIRVCEIDTDAWTIERWVANKWEVGAKGPSGDVETTPLFQVKAWLRPNRLVLDVKTRLAELVADATAKIPARRPAARAAKPTGNEHLLELAIPDLHLGKLAWAPETGHADYDLKIAEQLYESALDALLLRTASFRFGRIVLPIGNDFFHADTKQGTTTRGTPLDTDSRYHKSFLTGRRLIVRTIERLRALAPITVVVVPGNHDALSSFHLGDAIDCWFHATPEVTVMNQPVPRKYLRFGATALMFTHGEKGKAADYPLLFATEQPEMFGATRFREIHAGHLHQTRLTEKMGVRVRISPALCPPDSWHADNHYVGNVRGAEALVYHPDEGLVSVAHYSVLEERAQEAA